jgi:ubiquinone/menaquinone biosynthesis C-methylase UbiE
MFARFLETMHPGQADTIADIGVTSDREHTHSNYLEAWYPQKANIIAVGMEDAAFLEKAYPGLTFVRASGLGLPFSDKSFDFVHSSAVIEHVGSFANQTRLLSELWRIARRGIFVTTPNRWFPVELHTVLPFLHYLPPAQHRQILKKLGYGFFAEEKNLNLMSRASMTRAARDAGFKNFTVQSARLLGLTSNLLLVARKDVA